MFKNLFIIVFFFKRMFFQLCIVENLPVNCTAHNYFVISELSRMIKIIFNLNGVNDIDPMNKI